MLYDIDTDSASMEASEFSLTSSTAMVSGLSPFNEARSTGEDNENVGGDECSNDSDIGRRNDGYDSDQQNHADASSVDENKDSRGSSDSGDGNSSTEQHHDREQDFDRTMIDTVIVDTTRSSCDFGSENDHHSYISGISGEKDSNSINNDEEQASGDDSKSYNSAIASPLSIENIADFPVNPMPSVLYTMDSATDMTPMVDEEIIMMGAKTPVASLKTDIKTLDNDGFQAVQVDRTPDASSNQTEVVVNVATVNDAGACNIALMEVNSCGHAYTTEPVASAAPMAFPKPALAPPSIMHVYDPANPTSLETNDVPPDADSGEPCERNTSDHTKLSSPLSRTPHLGSVLSLSSAFNPDESIKPSSLNAIAAAAMIAAAGEHPDATDRQHLSPMLMPLTDASPMDSKTQPEDDPMKTTETESEIGAYGLAQISHIDLLAPISNVAVDCNKTEKAATLSADSASASAAEPISETDPTSPPESGAEIAAAADATAAPPTSSSQPNSRPTVPYATLITNAINSSPLRRITLNEIYNYAMAHYPYFRTAGSGWKNSIRHNLSLNKNFVRIPRPPNEKGKGAYWSLAPNSGAKRPVLRGTGALNLSNDDDCDEVGAGSIASRSDIPMNDNPKGYFSHILPAKKSRPSRSKKGAMAVASRSVGSGLSLTQVGLAMDGSKFGGFGDYGLGESSDPNSAAVLAAAAATAAAMAAGSISSGNINMDDMHFMYDQHAIAAENHAAVTALQAQVMQQHHHHHQQQQTQAGNAHSHAQQAQILHGANAYVNHDQHQTPMGHISHMPYGMISSDLIMQQSSELVDDAGLFDPHNAMHQLMEPLDASLISANMSNMNHGSLMYPDYSSQLLMPKSMSSMQSGSTAFGCDDGRGMMDEDLSSSMGLGISSASSSDASSSAAAAAASAAAAMFHLHNGTAQYNQAGFDINGEHESVNALSYAQNSIFGHGQIDMRGMDMSVQDSLIDMSMQKSISGRTLVNETSPLSDSSISGNGQDTIRPVGSIGHTGQERLQDTFLVSSQDNTSSYRDHEDALAFAHSFGHPVSYDEMGLIETPSNAPMFYDTHSMHGMHYPLVYGTENNNINSLALGNSMLASDSDMAAEASAAGMMTKQATNTNMQPSNMFAVNFPGEINTLAFDNDVDGSSVAGAAASGMHEPSDVINMGQNIQQQAWFRPQTHGSMYADLPLAMYTGSGADASDTNDLYMGGQGALRSVSNMITSPSSTGAAMSNHKTMPKLIENNNAASSALHATIESIMNNSGMSAGDIRQSINGDVSTKVFSTGRGDGRERQRKRHATESSYSTDHTNVFASNLNASGSAMSNKRVSHSLSRNGGAAIGLSGGFMHNMDEQDINDVCASVIALDGGDLNWHSGI